MKARNVYYEVDKHFAWLMMNRPEALNALSEGMFADLEEALRKASADHQVYWLGIKGAGRAFCAGLDIKEVSGFSTRQQAREFVYDLVKPFWERFIGCDKPIIAVVDGPAYGAGAEIAMASDVVLASPRSTFAFSGGRVGALCCISAVIGQFMMTGRKVVEMNLTGTPISADQAQALGMVSYVEDRPQIENRIRLLIDEMRHVSPISNSSFKRIRRELVTTRMLRAAYRELYRTITSKDFKQGAAAFAKKTRPEYYL